MKSARNRACKWSRPAKEIYLLFDLFVRPIQWVLLILTVMILIVSSVSILVSIYNSMNDRRQQIAIMRALGAGRGTVFTIILLESFFIATGGGVIGWAMGHAAGAVAGPMIERQTGVSVGFVRCRAAAKRDDVSW